MTPVVAPDVLVVAATEAEAAHVPPGLAVLITGIGKVSASCAVARELARRPSVEVVVNVGTVGALRPGRSGLLLPSTVVDHELSGEVLAAMGYPVTTEIELAGGDGSALATGDTFVTDAALRERLARRADAVDMEGFAVAWAARQAGVGCRLVKHVSDQADAESLNWPQRVDASARVLGDWLAQELR